MNILRLWLFIKVFFDRVIFVWIIMKKFSFGIKFNDSNVVV